MNPVCLEFNKKYETNIVKQDIIAIININQDNYFTYRSI